MKQRVFILILLFAGVMEATAQEIPVIVLPNEVFRTIKKQKDPVDSVAWVIKRSGSNKLSVNQGSLKNWAAGGDEFSLSINNYFNYFLYYKNGRHSWDNNFDFYFGLLQATSLGTRKNDDRLDLLTKYGYNFDGNWYLAGLFNFRSQLFDGYTYSGNTSSFSSTLLSPAYFTLSAGFDYKPNPELSVFLSPLTSRSVVIANDYLAAKGVYGVDSGRHYKMQIGFFSSVNYKKDFTDAIGYKGRLDLFSDYGSHPENIDVFMTNALLMKVNKYLTLSYNLDLIYDDDVKLFGSNGDSPALQIKSLIGLGVLINLNTVTIN